MISLHRLLCCMLPALAFGCNQYRAPADSSASISPAFALPCSGDKTCAMLDPCAAAGFDRCKGFHSVEGLKRQVTGSYGELAFRVQPITIEAGAPVSLWHDVPLIVADDENAPIVNAFFEISRGTQAKVELNKWAPHNPIWQDRKRAPGQNFERPRYLSWSPEPSNYGALPRTWENVLEDDARTGYPGDTDPIDVVDIGSKASPMGLVYR